MSDVTFRAPAVAPLVAQLAIHEAMLSAATADLTPEQWAHRHADRLNHPVWVVAHLVGVRRGILANLGGSPDGPDIHSAGFGDDCRPAADYPAPAELVSEFVALGDDSRRRLARIDEARLAEPFRPDFPDGKTRSLAEALPFLMSHEGLHIGHLGLLRRLVDLPGMAQRLLDE